jgi:uncharacterized protein DUF4352
LWVNHIYKLIAISGLIISVIIASKIGIKTNTVKAEENKSSKQIYNNETLNSTKSIKIGDLVFSVQKVIESNKNQYRTASKENKLLCIDLNIENKGTEEEQITAIMVFKLLGKNNVQYNIVLPEGNDSVNGIVYPNKAVAGKIWFEVPKESSSYELHIRPSMMNEEIAIINIKHVDSSYIVDDDINTDLREDINSIDNNINNNIQENEIVDNVFKVNKSIKIDNLIFNISKVSTSHYDVSKENDKEEHFINIELFVKNEGTITEQMTSITLFKLIDMNGQTYNIVLPEKDGINGLLESGKKISGSISFKVKDAKSNFKLQITPWITKEIKGYVDIDKLFEKHE